MWMWSVSCLYGMITSFYCQLHWLCCIKTMYVCVWKSHIAMLYNIIVFFLLLKCPCFFDIFLVFVGFLYFDELDTRIRICSQWWGTSVCLSQISFEVTYKCYLVFWCLVDFEFKKWRIQGFPLMILQIKEIFPSSQQTSPFLEILMS